MSKRISITCVLSLVIAIFALFAATGVIAQDCKMLFPGKGNKPPIEITVEPIFLNGKFPFLIDETKTIPTPDNGTITLKCPDDNYPCIAAPYIILGGKLNELWLSHDAQVNEVFGLRGIGNSSGWEPYEACDENSFLRSCQEVSYRITTQTDPSADTQRFVIYYGPGAPGNVLETDIGNLAGGLGSNTLLCEYGITTASVPEISIIASTEISFTAEDPTSGDKYRIRIEKDQAGNILHIYRCLLSPDGTCSSEEEITDRGIPWNQIQVSVQGGAYEPLVFIPDDTTTRTGEESTCGYWYRGVFYNFCG